MSGAPPTTDLTFTCDSCEQEASGYSKTELGREGWKWYSAGSANGKMRMLCLCGDCVAMYEERRAGRGSE
jgi:hypothetical protein